MHWPATRTIACNITHGGKKQVKTNPHIKPRLCHIPSAQMRTNGSSYSPYIVPPNKGLSSPSARTIMPPTDTEHLACITERTRCRFIALQRSHRSIQYSYRSRSSLQSDQWLDSTSDRTETLTHSLCQTTSHGQASFRGVESLMLVSSIGNTVYSQYGRRLYVYNRFPGCYFIHM